MNFKARYVDHSKGPYFDMRRVLVLSLIFASPAEAHGLNLSGFVQDCKLRLQALTSRLAEPHSKLSASEIATEASKRLPVSGSPYSLIRQTYLSPKIKDGPRPLIGVLRIKVGRDSSFLFWLNTSESRATGHSEVIAEIKRLAPSASVDTATYFFIPTMMSFESGEGGSKLVLMEMAFPKTPPYIAELQPGAKEIWEIIKEMEKYELSFRPETYLEFGWLKDRKRKVTYQELSFSFSSR